MLRNSPPPRSPAFAHVLAAVGAGSLLLSLVPLVAREGGKPEVLRIELNTIIHPVAAEFVADAVAAADSAGTAALVLELNTPGGLVTSTREIVTTLLGSRTPVVVYVAPKGAQAASAGFYLLMAADIAAMAPGANTGAATPVEGQGQEIGETLKAKMEQDAAAMIRSLAQRRGRNVELAEEAVLKARSFSAEEALEGGLIDLVAPDLETLLTEIDGREVAREPGPPVVLRTAGAPVRTLEMTLFQRILSVIVQPTIAYLLLSLGGLGLIIELYNPGAIFPGVVGAICLVLAFYGLSVLPVSYAGVALILLALLFFIAEIKVTSYGLLGVAGIICLVLGGLMLFKTPEPALRVSLQVIVALALFSAATVGLLMLLVIRAHSHHVRTGFEGLVHEQGEARSSLNPKGKVFVHGELWNAVSDTPVAAGEPVEVVAVENLILRVRPVRDESPASTRGTGGPTTT